MNPVLTGALLSVALTVGIVAMIEVGRKFRLRDNRRHGEDAGKGLGPVDGAVFGLMGLLLAFTFSGAATRLDVRRQQIVDEANNIGTAYLRLDLVPPEARPPLKEKFRQYLDARLAAYDAMPDINKAKAKFAEADVLQQEIWNDAVAAVGGLPHPQAATLLLPAINEMFDIAATRLAATRMHPPLLIYAMLLVVAMICSLLAGYDMGTESGRNWFHILAFAVMLGGAVYVIVDLEYPRVGLIRIDSFDELLVDVRQQMR